MADACTLILFTRIPVVGKVKTRLQPVLSPEECAILQEAMILDLAEKLSGFGNPIQLSYSDEWRDEEGGEELRDAFIERVRDACSAADSFSALPQEGSGLGPRMAQAMQAAFDAGAGACLLLGSDLPDIMHSDILVAERALSYSDVVLGPSSDGGYWIVGAKSPFPQMFEDMVPDTQSVLTKAVATCRAHGRSVALSRETFDLDVPEDYYQLCSQVSQGDFRLGARTVEAVRHLMAVSAVPPASPQGD